MSGDHAIAQWRYPPGSGKHRRLSHIQRQPQPVNRSPYLIGLNHDIYGMPLTLRFLKRVRDERKFSSPQALKEQISIDCDITLEINHKAHQP